MQTSGVSMSSFVVLLLLLIGVLRADCQVWIVFLPSSISPCRLVNLGSEWLSELLARRVSLQV